MQGTHTTGIEIFSYYKYINMATQLSFSKDGNIWRAKYTSKGDAVVQLSRKGVGKVVVYCNIAGMPPVPVCTFTEYEAGQYVIFNAAVPAGCEVTIESASEVTAANML